MKAVVAFLVVLCYLPVTCAWTCTEAPQLSKIQQVHTGNGHVVAVTSSYYAYFLSGKTWYRLGTHRLKQVSVGPAGIWGTDYKDRIYKFVAGNFRQVSGGLSQVDAGGNGQLVGINRNKQLYCLRSSYAMTYNAKRKAFWNYLKPRMKYISCSATSGCWATDTYNRIFYTRSIAASTCRTSRWSRIPGSAKTVKVGNDGTVFVVNKSGHVYQRTATSRSRPAGKGWSHVFVCVSVSQASYDLGHLWVVGKGGTLLCCTR